MGLPAAQGGTGLLSLWMPERRCHMIPLLTDPAAMAAACPPFPVIPYQGDES